MVGRKETEKRVVAQVKKLGKNSIGEVKVWRGSWCRVLRSAYYNKFPHWQDTETSYFLPDTGNVQNYSRSRRRKQKGDSDQTWRFRARMSPYIPRARDITLE